MTSSQRQWLYSSVGYNYLYNFPIGPPHRSGRVYFPFLDSDVFDSDKDFRRFEHRFSMETS